MKIGGLELDNPLILAPMAGYTNLPFRVLAKREGCALVCSEMVSAIGLVRGTPKTWGLLTTCAEEKPFSVQLFGSDPKMMADAAQIVAQKGADILDINLGCSVKKIVRNGSGAALMNDPTKTEAILSQVKKSIRIPVTIKIRSGWDRSGHQACIIAQIAQSCGIDAVTVHPRTAAQGFSGKADWPLIKKIKGLISIPVVGNGDIEAAEDVLRMQEVCDCDGVMIGRAALGNPWIFSQTLALVGGEPVHPVDLAERFETMRSYLEASVQFLGEGKASHMMRSRLGWFTRGLPYSSRFREALKQISSPAEARTAIYGYQSALEQIR